MMGTCCATLCTCEKVASCFGMCWSLVKRVAKEDIEKKDVNISFNMIEMVPSAPALSANASANANSNANASANANVPAHQSASRVSEPGGKRGKSAHIVMNVMNDVRHTDLATKYYELLESNVHYADIVIEQTKTLKSFKYMLGAIELIAIHQKSTAQRLLIKACEIEYKILLDIYEVLR